MVHSLAHLQDLIPNLIGIMCTYVSVFVHVCMYECLPMRLLITSGVLWHDMNLI